MDVTEKSISFDKRVELKMFVQDHGEFYIYRVLATNYNVRAR